MIFNWNIDSVTPSLLSADTQYMIIQKNLKISKMVNLYVSLYNNELLIFKCFHDEQHAQWCEKAL